MDVGFETLESGFSDFDVDIQETRAKKVAKYDRMFSVKTGGGSIFTKPLIVEGVIYFGASDNYIYAIDAKTKEVKWKFKTGGPVLIEAEIKNNVIYFGSYDGYFYALNAETGKEIWRFRTHGKIVCKPLIADDSLIFGSEDGYFYMVDLEGKEIWRFKTGDNTSFSPVREDNKVFVGSYDHNLYCIDLQTGKEIWRFRAGAEVVCYTRSPIKDGVIYITSIDNYAYAIRTDNGEEIWRFKAGEHGMAASPVLHGNRLYIGTRDNHLICTDLNSEEIWRFRAGSVIEGCLVYNDVIYLASDDYHVYAIDYNTGKEIWRLRTGGECFLIPTLYEGNIYVGSADCKLYCIDITTGKSVWTFQTSSNLKSEFAPLYEEYRVEIKHETGIEDTISEEKYKSKGDVVSLSNYDVRNEYAMTSEYKQKSEYDVQWVIFEEILTLGPDTIQENHLKFQRRL